MGVAPGAHSLNSPQTDTDFASGFVNVNLTAIFWGFVAFTGIAVGVSAAATGVLGVATEAFDATTGTCGVGAGAFGAATGVVGLATGAVEMGAGAVGLGTGCAGTFGLGA